MKNIISKIKEYYPVIAIGLIFFLLLIDCENYTILTIFSNTFGFSILSNSHLIEKYKNNNLLLNSAYGMIIINIINILGCIFLEYQNYTKTLILAVIVIVLSLTLYTNGKTRNRR